jgi:hypothetical protein
MLDSLHITNKISYLLLCFSNLNCSGVPMIGPLSGCALIAMFTLLFSLGSDDGSSDPKHKVCFRQNIVVLTDHFLFYLALAQFVSICDYGLVWLGLE